MEDIPKEPSVKNSQKEPKEKKENFTQIALKEENKKEIESKSQQNNKNKTNLIKENKEKNNNNSISISNYPKIKGFLNRNLNKKYIKDSIIINDEYMNNDMQINYESKNYPINLINIRQNGNEMLNNQKKDNKNFNKDNTPFVNSTSNFFGNNYLKKPNLSFNIFNINNNSFNNINNNDKIKLISNIDIILSLLTNYNGSRFLQDIVTNSDNNEISILLKTTYPQIAKIMCLEYGNYFVQKLIKKLNTQQRIIIYQLIENDFLNIAKNKSGTHVIQTLIDSIQSPIEQIFLEKLLNKDMLTLFNNENSYHIIMKLILEKPENMRNNINFFFVENIEKIIINPYGAFCGVKFILNNTNLNLRLILIKNIENNIKTLIFNKNSCIFLMSAIKQFGINNFEFIIQDFYNNLSFLTLNPISNSFIFKLFHYLKTRENSKLILIIWNIYRNDNLIKSLCSHKYGKKLLNQLMEYSNNNQKKFLKMQLKLLNCFNLYY